MFDYDVAISFAGEQRKEAEAIADCLKKNEVNVFYDGYEKAHLWGKDLYEHLSRRRRDTVSRSPTPPKCANTGTKKCPSACALTKQIIHPSCSFRRHGDTRCCSFAFFAVLGLLAISGMHPIRAHPISFIVTMCVWTVLFMAVNLVGKVQTMRPQEDDARPSRVIPIDPVTNLTCHYWHVFVPGITAGQIYAYRVHGVFDPARGIRFDPGKALLDPYDRGVVVPEHYSREAAGSAGENFATSMKSVVFDPSAYDWEGDTTLQNPATRTIIYELHVKGFTGHPNSGVAENLRGTFRGLTEKIAYLQDLGITAVELLPVFAFDRQDCPAGLVNYWGYAPVSFFSLHPAYSSRHDPLGPMDEFRDMVKALHRAGIEVILDVVFNHTAEGDENGPTFSFRGIDNRAY